MSFNDRREGETGSEKRTESDPTPILSEHGNISILSLRYTIEQRQVIFDQKYVMEINQGKTTLNLKEKSDQWKYLVQLL